MQNVGAANLKKDVMINASISLIVLQCAQHVNVRPLSDHLQRIGRKTITNMEISAMQRYCICGSHRLIQSNPRKLMRKYRKNNSHSFRVSKVSISEVSSEAHRKAYPRRSRSDTQPVKTASHVRLHPYAARIHARVCICPK
jgi:hypothetical protein